MMTNLVSFVDIIIIPLMIDLEATIHILWATLDDLLIDEGISFKKVIVMIIFMIVNICTIITFLRIIIYVTSQMDNMSKWNVKTPNG